MSKELRNTLLGRKLEFGDKNQIQAAFKINDIAVNGFCVREDEECFECFKCKSSLYYDKQYSCCDCGHFTNGSVDPDDHDPECGYLEAAVINQILVCRRCKSVYKIKEDPTEDYGHGWVVGLHNHREK